MRVRPQLLTLIGMTLLPLATLGLVAAALAALSPQSSPLASPLILTLGQSRAADAALAAVSPDLEAAALASLRAIDHTPYDSSSRLRLAYIDSLDGGLSPQGLEHLETSYALLPLDQYVATWRVGFALEHWGDLTPELRKKVEAEAFAFLGTSRRREMLATLEAVDSPTGIVPAIFWRERLKRPRRP
ncbi:hypothetical protein [Phenylobacterium sp.]|uniref:hypothetical protein n=1 Tax=Phenylobacterium sp. TaxID=1871053 RepID=UPI00272F66B9|nr:hypothetical protein [Phenylobacterium sp.]MDP1875910.1 hypothetical protein [Phenylobacterium sp.]